MQMHQHVSVNGSTILRNGSIALATLGWLIPLEGEESGSLGLPDTISYYEHVRPIFQAKCHGCHQPARSRGDYIMTDVAQLIQGGEGGEAVVVAHEPTESYLLDMVTVQPGDDRPEMPEDDEPLTPYEVALVIAWIDQGALDDTPDNARQRYDQDNPPQYAVPPVLTSLDFSPDGKLLAVAGFHEVLLHRANGSGLEARLIGLSERIESARFSPDGKRLVVAGGLPGRMGEIQIWDVDERKLILSKPVGFDTAYGASWSPDGKFVSYGLPDNTVRAIDAETGEQSLFMGGHNDWVLDTTWSVQGDYLVSVGRDMSAKLTEVETERFIDNITSITPGALKGGLNAIDRHPFQDHILVGGADGLPQIYRMYRETNRKIGDNANLIRKYPSMKGRIWSAAFAPDGKTFASVSSFNGLGQINLYRSEYDATITEDLKKRFETARRNPDGSKNIDPVIEKFQTDGAKLLHSLDLDSPVFSVAYSPDGKTIVAGTSDGRIQFVDALSGERIREIVPIEVSNSESLALSVPMKLGDPISHKKGVSFSFDEHLPKGSRVASLEIAPRSIQLGSPQAYSQLLVTGRLNTGEAIDLTRLVDWKLNQRVAEVDERGMIRPASEGHATLTATLGGKKTTANVVVGELGSTYNPDFIKDVNPILTRLGCNAGACHGAQDGKAGFKLSLRGYDMVHDVRAFSDDHAARRVNFASPDDSLMLLKATGAVPHEGSAVTDVGSDFYEVIRQWIIDGATFDKESEKVSRIEIEPQNPVIQGIGGSQQIRVIAHYPDGSERDVTGEAIVESGNTEVALTDDFGLLSTVRRGEAPILVRYEGAYAATTLTVMGDRTGFEWEEPENWNEIDALVTAKWERMKIRPSRLTTDIEFIRRIHIDLTGLPPTPEQVTNFVQDSRLTQEKRSATIDALIGSKEFIENWSNKWADLLQVNSKFLGKEGASLFRDWIRAQVASNKPYDEFVYDILTATGSNKENPAASYYKILRTPEELVENTTHLFLGTRFNCNKCHDHPFERWNVDNYYQTAAYFSQIDLSRDKTNAPKENIGGSAVENAKPLFEVIEDKLEGDIVNIVTGKVADPEFPYPAIANAPIGGDETPSRREQLAAWLTAEDNQFFAKSYANRIWGYLTGTGLIEPIDDIRAGNPPTNPELMDYLTNSFIDSGFDVRALMREICNSRTYQLSIETNPFNEDDTINYSHAKARRLPAEALYDAVHAVTGSIPDIPGAKPGMRAAELADAALDTKSGFLANLGRPARESACECDRQNDVQLGAVMSLLSGPSVAEAIGDPKNRIAELARSISDDRALIEKLYLRVLNRLPSDRETMLVLDNWSQIEGDHQSLLDRLVQAESDWVYRKARLEGDRLAAVAQAGESIEAYEPEYLRNRKVAQEERADRIALAESELRTFEDSTLPALRDRTIEFLEPKRFKTLWTPRIPGKAEAERDRLSLAIQQDGSVIASGDGQVNAVYKLEIPLDSGGVTGVMLEALTDESLPGFGPGLHESGKFVITEFEVGFRPGESSEKAKDLKLVEAVADFTEPGYDVLKAINKDKDRDDKGWSIGDRGGETHWARFALEKPLNVEQEESTLVVTITCRYSDNEFPIGKFRIYTTDSEAPLKRGLSESIASILSKSEVDRSSIDKSTVLDWVKLQQPEYLQKRFAWITAKRPVPADPKMEALKASLAKAELQVPIDPSLTQLRRDVRYSAEQAANRRLTAAQDLTWALINNAAFIFNY